MSTSFKSLVLLSFTALGASFAAEPSRLWTHDPATDIGPFFWGAVAPDFATCGAKSAGTFVEVGQKQTPINIETAKAVRSTLAALTFQYQDTPFTVENTGHVVEVPYAAGSTLRLGQFTPSLSANLNWSQPTDEFQLVQFHFHAPSEHTIDGKSFDLELHLVHANQVGDLAVVGVLMSAGSSPNYFVDQIMNLAPAEEGEASQAGATFNVTRLLPDDKSYYLYSGSLTTPPCTEGVRWLVLKNPVQVSTFAIQQMHRIVSHFPGYGGFPNNNRLVQATHGRNVFVDRR